MSTVVEDAFVAAGFKPLKPKKVRPHKIQKCRKCGSEMKLITDTNVMVCTGDVEKIDDEGKSHMIPCNNRFIFKIDSEK